MINALMNLKMLEIKILRIYYLIYVYYGIINIRIIERKY